MRKFDFSLCDEICFLDDNNIDLFINTIPLRKKYPELKRVLFNNVHTAVDYLEKNKDCRRIFFLDLHIGTESGFDFLKIIEQKSLSNTNIIMLTSSRDPSDKEKALSFSSLDAFCVKPMTTELLNSLDININRQTNHL